MIDLLMFISRKTISIRLQSAEQRDLWDWSHGFDINAIGVYNFMARSVDRTEVKYMKTTVTLQKSTIFIVVEEEKQEKMTFKIRNECPGIDIRVYQEGTNPLEGFMIHPGQVIPWSWELPSRKKEFLVDFSLNEEEEFLSFGQKFSFDTLNKIQRITIPSFIKERLNKVYSIVTMEGNTKVLTFFVLERGRMVRSKVMKLVKELQKREKQEGNSVVSFNLDINLKGLGISVISRLYNRETKRKERKEILYLLVKGLEFRLLDSIDNRTAQLRFKYLNIDNNTFYDTTFPVLLTPSKPRGLAPDTRNYFLDVLVSQRKLAEIQHFETFQVLLDEVTVKTDGMFLDSILETINAFIDIFKDKNPSAADKTISECLYSSPEEAQKLEDPEYFDSKLSWRFRPIPELTSNLFVQNLVFHPIFINLSFQLKRRDVAENIFFLVNLFATVLGTAIVNLDNAPLRLKGFKMNNVFDSQEAISKKILDKFKDEAAKSVFKLLGSLDIVGNPVGLFNNISIGIVDLFEKPIDGFLQGPLEGGKGVIKGATSLVKNTVSGAFNSIGKVAGSLATGLSSLSLDKDYLVQREKARLSRPNHIGDGVYQGLNSLVKGVSHGVKGVIVKPIEGASEGGVSGFLKGTLKGITGFFVNPLTGALDAASKTAEGIHNTANLFEQKPNTIRLRFPRAFYGNERFYRTYFDTDAEILWLLHYSKNPKFRALSLVSAFDIFPEENQKEISFILALAYESVLLWDVKKARKIWAFDPKDVLKIIVFRDGIQIQIDESAEFPKEKCIRIKNSDSVQNEFIGKKLAQLKRQVQGPAKRSTE